MPDGKADRHILPGNSFRSGLRAGRAAERERAVRAFANLIIEEGVANGESVEEMKAKFREFLRQEDEKAV